MKWVGMTAKHLCPCNTVMESVVYVSKLNSTPTTGTIEAFALLMTAFVLVRLKYSRIWPGKSSYAILSGSHESTAAIYPFERTKKFEIDFTLI